MLCYSHNISENKLAFSLADLLKVWLKFAPHLDGNLAVLNCIMCMQKLTGVATVTKEGGA